MTIPASLINFINAEVSLDPSEVIDGDTDLLLTGLVDSLGVIRIVAWLEETLDIVIDPTDVVLDNFQTCRQMVDFVDRVSHQTA